MSRKQAIFLFVFIILITLIGLFVLAVYSIWFMLGAVLAIVVILILLLQSKPDFFSFLRKEKKQPPAVNHAQQQNYGQFGYLPSLILVTGGSSKSNTLTGGQIVVSKETFSIGRSTGCDYSIPQAHDISRKHCVIRFDSALETSFLMDNGSSNGTFLNGERLDPMKEYPIRNGDSIQMGSLRYIAQTAHYGTGA